MADTQKSVITTILILFTLLGALFGAQIMTFIFGQLGGDIGGFDDTSSTRINETGAWLNSTTYTVDQSSVAGFSTLAIIEAFNATDDTPIGTGNFSVLGDGFTNSTVVNWDDVIVSYTYSRYSDQRMISDSVQNNSLEAINTYSQGAGTQMTVVSIVVILLLLIGLFVVFWKSFMGDGTKGSGMAGNFVSK